jgi:hypothetical protein
MRYALAGVNKAYVGFGNAGDPNFDISNVATGGHINLFPNANVGIGTTSPSQKLETNGNIRIKFDSANNDGFTHYAANNTTHLISLTRQGNDAAVSGAEGIKFYVNCLTSPTSGTQAIQITSTANVGIGTTSPTSRLDVNGTTRSTNFTTNGTNFFTYSETDFTPVIGFLTGATNNFVEAAVGATITSFSYNIQTGRITRIGSMMTVVVDISFNITMSVAAAPGIYIAIRLPAECRPASVGATAGGSWPQSIDTGNMRGYVLLNGTDSGGNIAYISPVTINERMLWSIYGTSPQSNQRLFATMTYILR